MPWLSASGSARCSVDAEALAARIASAAVGTRNPALHVTVVLRDTKRGTSAAVSLSQGARRLGRQRLVADTCDEALAAVVAVTALASSSLAEPTAAESREDERQLGPRSAGSPRSAQQPTTGVTAAPALQPVPRIDAGPITAGDVQARRAWLSFGTGADLMGPDGVASLSLGAALHTARGAWRAQLWYGLPSWAEEEEAQPRRSLKQRSERGAAALDYCRDLAAGGWLSVCGGLELGVARRWRAEAQEAEAPLERRWFEPWLAAALGSRLSYRAAHWQPGIELTTLLPVLATGDGRRVGLRAQASVAVPF